MTKLLSDFDSEKTVHHIPIDNPEVSYADVIANFPNQENVVLIFCGNGEEDALWAGARQECSDLKDPGEEWVFYDSGSFDKGPETLAAFCSSAGKDLGPAFVKTNNGSFLGFSDELWLLPGLDEECNSWWGKILKGFIGGVVEDEAVDGQTVNFVRLLHQEALDYFSSEERRSADEALGMRMCLRRNLSALCSY